MRKIKTHGLASIYLFVLVLTLGVMTLAAPLNAATLEANVDINPDRVTLGVEPPKRFEFKLWFSGKYKDYNVSDIRRKTILIDGVLKPQGPWKIKDDTLTFRVKGDHLINYVIWPKIYHMARVDPNPDQGTWFPYKIDITVTGEFTDGTPFSGTSTIHVFVPKSDPPPPPPPP